MAERDRKHYPSIVYEVAEKLIGGIEPIADSAYDKKCLENMRLYDELATMLIEDILRCTQYRNSEYASMREVGEYAMAFADGFREMVKEDSEWLTT